MCRVISRAGGDRSLLPGFNAVHITPNKMLTLISLWHRSLFTPLKSDFYLHCSIKPTHSGHQREFSRRFFFFNLTSWQRMTTVTSPSLGFHITVLSWILPNTSVTYCAFLWACPPLTLSMLMFPKVLSSSLLGTRKLMWTTPAHPLVKYFETCSKWFCLLNLTVYHMKMYLESEKA